VHTSEGKIRGKFGNEGTVQGSPEYMRLWQVPVLSESRDNPMDYFLSDGAQDCQSGSHWPARPVLHRDELTRNFVMRFVGHRSPAE
jgi:hypothetical protein